MTLLSPAHLATWIIVAIAVFGVIVRPGKMPEATWAALGAAMLVFLSLISAADAWAAIRKGTDVYLFLIGMMVLAELGRHEGLFDWLAAYAVLHARGSAARLFALIYLVGTLVTVFLSNDATAVVLTPAVYAATQRAGARPLPYLLICAFIANAASFVLPISNPANLVVYGAHLPSLWTWLGQFAVPSIAAIVVTFIALRFTQRTELTAEVSGKVVLPALALGGRIAAGGIAATALILLTASSLDWQLGLPTFLAGVGTSMVILALKAASPWPIVKDISWSVLPLVAGLFVLVQGIDSTGVIAPLTTLISSASHTHPQMTALAVGSSVAVASNVVNNLPLGLVAGDIVGAAHLTPHIAGALLIGVDLGPNLSVTGSLATILWLVALRREGQNISAWKFLMLGSVVMPPALMASLGSFVWLALR
jgi:arsenical pump membrane protein